MLIASIILGILGLVGTIIGTSISATENGRSIAETNQTNLQIARETNASNVEQANLAYQRSLPTNQVKNLMDAGMSRAGALSALTGGGSYTAPTLQTGAPMQPKTLDLSGLESAFGRLGNIPSNVEQYNLVEDQRKALQVDTQNKIDANKRAEQLHQFEMWSRQYGKDNATALDSASSIIANTLLDSGKDIKDFNSFEDLINGLDLQKNPQIRNMPASVRAQVEESVRNKFADALARRSADDQHNISEQTLNDLKAAAADFNAAKNAREKEYKARELRAKIDVVLAQDGLSLADYQHSLEFDDNGNVKPSRKVSEKAKRAWDRLADTIGVDVLRDLIRGLVTIAK